MKKYFFYFVLFSALLMFTGCSALFQDKVTMPSADGTLNDLFEDPDIKIELQAPRQVFVSQGLSPVDITVSWNRVQGAVSYYVYRAAVPVNADGSSTPPDEGVYEPLKRVYNSTSYSDKIIDTEPAYKNAEYKNHYYYMICAENLEGEGPFSSAVYGYLLAAPLSVSAETGISMDRIRVMWNKVPGASQYRIYRSENANGTGSEYLAGIGSNELKYDNEMSAAEQGSEFYYQISAVSAQGIESVKSPLAMGFSLMPGAPPTPVITSVSRGKTSDRISLTFEGNSSGDVTYVIFRNSSEDSTLIKLGNPSGNTYDDIYAPAADQYFRPGIYYYYFVQAMKKDDETGLMLKSPFSSATDKSGKIINKGYMLSPPSVIEALSEPGGLRFNWKPSIGSDEHEASAYSYILYHSNMKEGPFAQITTASPVDADNGYLTWQYTDPQYNNGFFKLTTLSGGIESSQSIVVEPSPSAAGNIQATKEKNLENGIQPNGNGVYPVQLSWESPAGGAAGYHVFRSTSADSGFRKITEKPVTATVYTDKNDTAKSGIYYYYRVLSLNSLEQGSVYSNTEYGYGVLNAPQFYREYVKTLNSSQKKLTLMHKSNDMDKLGSESANGGISGNLSYSASVQGLGARILMKYSNYSDFKDPAGNRFMVFNGDTNTTANMSSNGNMDGTVTVSGMYHGTVGYNSIEIKGGDAGGGNYLVTSSTLAPENVPWNIK